MAYRKIVVGTDGSVTASEAVEYAAGLARLHSAGLVLVHAGNEQSPRAQEIVDAARALPALADVDLQTVIEEGDPAEVLIRVAEREDADLIAVGNKGMQRASRFLLGNVPNKVSHHAPCDLLIVKTT